MPRKTRQFLATIESPSKGSMRFLVLTTSAKLVGRDMGHREPGENICVYARPSGILLSKAKWCQEKQDYISIPLKGDLNEKE